MRLLVLRYAVFERAVRYAEGYGCGAERNAVRQHAADHAHGVIVGTGIFRFLLDEDGGDIIRRELPIQQIFFGRSAHQLVDASAAHAGRDFGERGRIDFRGNVIMMEVFLDELFPQVCRRRKEVHREIEPAPDGRIEELLVIRCGEQDDVCRKSVKVLKKRCDNALQLAQLVGIITFLGNGIK